MWILYAILIICLILLGVSALFLNFIFGKRCEGNENLKYFTAEEFNNLKARPIEFKSNKGQILRGNIYTNSKIKEYKGLIIFVHGMGAGHLSYTTEINTFAEAGYIVLAYDNTGTCKSEGKKLNGFFQSVLDLENALKFAKNHEELKQYDISLVGHSWGAYTVCQILQFNHNIKSVVAFSGPNDSSKLICDFLGNAMKVDFSFLQPFLKLMNFIKFGKKSLKKTTDILKQTKVPVLLLHGEKDETVSLKNSLIFNKEIFKDKENIKMLIYADRYHNVYQTKESEKYLNTVFAEIAEMNKKYKNDELKEKITPIYNNIDYKKITEEDSDVMKEVISFLN